MGVTIERLRAGVVAVAGLIAVVVAGFLLYAHREAHHWLGELPGRLGAEIQKETNGFTYSQSVKGRTVFSIHAAKATQRKDGQTQLHDVHIVLFGKDGQSDRIAGKDFTYDQQTGVVRALGRVELDLQGPGAGAEGSAATRQPVHVVTSGLVFLQKLGVASTAEPIRFELPGTTGDAKGASFNTDTGVTTLESDVRVTSVKEGRTALLVAAHAELDRPSHRLLLRSAHLTLVAKTPGEKASDEVVQAERMDVALSEGGAVRGVTAGGGVEVVAQGGVARAPDAVLTLGAQQRPELVRMTGGVTFAQTSGEGATEGARGRAATATGHFSEPTGALEVLELEGSVRAESAGPQGAARAFQAENAVLHFGSAQGTQQARLERIDAMGSAQVISRASGVGAPREELKADRLLATFGAEQDGKAQLRQVTGAGHTGLRRVDAVYDEVSQGETMEARFATEPSGSRAKQAGAAQLVWAVQRGDVQMERRWVGQTGPGSGGVTGGSQGSHGPEHGRGAELVYDPVAGRDTLRGEARLWDETASVQAAEVTVEADSGDAVATGDVKVAYQPEREGGGAGPEREPVHVLSGRAVLHRSAETAEFRLGGAGQREPRMWQDGSLLEAPVLLLDRAAGTLEARGLAGSDPRGELPVLTVFSPKAQVASGATVAGQEGYRSPAGSGMTRVRSGSVVYDDRARTADFLGRVRVEDGGSEMESRQATAVLKPLQGTGTPRTETGAMMSGELDRVVAVGDVIVRQPGRTAEGAKAVYTPSDQTVVLTGLPGKPPRVTDAVQGTVTGDALRFREGDTSVMVEGRGRAGEQQSGDGRVHTRTRVRQTE